jgi:hypothetical protein
MGYTPAASVSSPHKKSDDPENLNFISNKPPSSYSVSVKCRHYAGYPAHVPLIQSQPLNRPTEDDLAHIRLTNYLSKQNNRLEDITKLHRILTMRNVILEIGCGDCEAAHEIAIKNPDWGVIATDKYAWEVSSAECSHYHKLAQKWKAKRLKVQQTVPANLVLLRAEAEILNYIPDQRIDSVLLVNPEPLVGQAFLDLLSEHLFDAKIKHGDRQLVIVPFSREMGVTTCGGNEFEHAEDWSMGLGFIMSSRFKFQKANRIQWDVDLRGLSTYSKNSTQTNVYLYGNNL